MLRWLKRLALVLALFVFVLLAPIGVVELACRGEPIEQTEASYITAPEDQRPEARTFMVYPEWHIVYAYEGYAEALKDGLPHHFPYLGSIWGFWKSTCALTSHADTLGKAGFASKATIYTIGVSFTAEMLFKAAYEETVGRVMSWFGAPGTADAVEAAMATEYAQFLQQVPWYKFDFTGWSDRLSAVEGAGPRDTERKLALGLEWGAKAAYARVIANAVGAVGADQLDMKIAVRGPLPDLPEIEVLSVEGNMTVARVPRYRIFTKIAQQVAEAGGEFVEIAGNDDILVSMILNGSDFYESAPSHRLISRTARVGFAEKRLLLTTKVSELHRMFLAYPETALRVEHIYDY